MESFRPKVLVIDDEPAILRTLSTTLRLEGYSCSVEPDPSAALMRLRAEPFHIVITDLVMPEMDGLDLVRKMREDRILAEVIVITAYNSLERAVEAYGLGVTDYLVKPFKDLDEIRRVVSAAETRLQRWRKIMAGSMASHGDLSDSED